MDGKNTPKEFQCCFLSLKNKAAHVGLKHCIELDLRSCVCGIC
jgi:hypothetical protein